MVNLVKICDFCWKGVLKNWNVLKWGLRELLREREKGVLRAARPYTPFQREYPPGLSNAPLSLFKNNRQGDSNV